VYYNDIGLYICFYHIFSLISMWYHSCDNFLIWHCVFLRHVIWRFVCLFVLAARAIFQLSDGCHHYRWQGCKFRPMLGAQGLWTGRDFYRATPTATRNPGLYGLIRKTGTYVPHWDSNPRRNDHQISNHCATQAAVIWKNKVKKKPGIGW
jgi:hypothetical protein